MELNAKYQFKRIGEEHIAEITRLYKLVFNSKISEAELHRVFDTRIFGKYTIGFLAISETGETAAYYGVFPIIGAHGGTQILMAQSGATMTHPDHQKKGLFVTLAKMTFEAAQKEGVQFIYGFPNENSLPGFEKKLDWRFQDKLYKNVLLTGAFPLCELASKNKLVKHIYQKILSSRISKLKLSPQNVLFRDTSIAHSVEFLAYKLRDPNVHLVRLNGIDFLVKSSPHLLIGDIGFNQHLNPSNFRFSLIQLGRIFMASKVILQFTKNHWIASFLEYSELTESLPVGILSFENEGEERELEFNYSDLDTF
jgi:hypothetical protein